MIFYHCKHTDKVVFVVDCQVRPAVLIEPIVCTPAAGADPGFLCRGSVDAMASAEREPITGVWGQSPQRGPGAEPLVEGQGGEAPLKLKAFQFLDVKMRQQICPILAFWELGLAQCTW